MRSLQSRSRVNARGQSPGRKLSRGRWRWQSRSRSRRGRRPRRTRRRRRGGTTWPQSTAARPGRARAPPCHRRYALAHVRSRRPSHGPALLLSPASAGEGHGRGRSLTSGPPSRPSRTPAGPRASRCVALRFPRPGGHQDHDHADAHDRDHAFAEALAAGRSEHGRLYPLKRDVAAFADVLLGILFAQLSDDGAATTDDLSARLILVRRDLRRLVEPLAGPEQTDAVVAGFAAALPGIHERLVLDAEAICAGDPAAESVDEVIAAYPGFLAIAIHRIAHEIRRPRRPDPAAPPGGGRPHADRHRHPPGRDDRPPLLHRPRHRRGGRRDGRHRRRRQALPGRHAGRPLGGQERGRHEAPPDDRRPGRHLRQRHRPRRRHRHRRRQRRGRQRLPHQQRAAGLPRLPDQPATGSAAPATGSRTPTSSSDRGGGPPAAPGSAAPPPPCGGRHHARKDTTHEGRLHPRHHREHAARPGQPALRPAGRGLAQARARQSRRQHQGPHRPGHDRGRRAARRSSGPARSSSSRRRATPGSAWPSSAPSRATA